MKIKINFNYYKDIMKKIVLFLVLLLSVSSVSWYSSLNWSFRVVNNYDWECWLSQSWSFINTPSNNLCERWSFSTVDDNGSWSWVWTCEWKWNWLTSTCSAVKAIEPVNGICWSSHQKSFINVPSTNLCSMWTATEVVWDGPWSWSCEWNDTWESVECQSERVARPSSWSYTIFNDEVTESPEVTVSKEEQIEQDSVKVLEPEKEFIEPKNESEDKITKMEQELIWEIELKSAIEPKNIPVKPKKKTIKTVKKIVDYSNKKWKTLIERYPKQLIKTGAPILSRVKVISSKYIDTKVEDSSLQLLDKKNTDINHWKNILPAVDRNRGVYIVTPSNGMIIPVSRVEEWTDDYKNALQWRKFNHVEYMNKWALEYPWSSINDYGEVWNKVIFGHSSYWKDKEWRYKTLFQKIIELEEKEEIWVYVKNSLGNYDRYEYFVSDSYKTNPDDIGVMKPWYGRQLTLITCTPIGGTQWRWVVRAQMNDTFEIEEIVESYLLPNRYKSLVIKYLEGFEKKIQDRKKLKQTYFEIFLKTKKKLKEENNNHYIKNTLLFLEAELSRRIKQLS